DAIPIARMNGVLYPRGADQSAGRRGRQAAKLDRGTVASDRLDPHRLLFRIDTGHAVEIGQSLVIIIFVALPLDRLTGLVFDELERTGSEDVFLIPARVLIENLLLVDPGEGVGERRQECAGREFETEDHGQWIGGLDLVDHDIKTLARAGHTFGWIDDLVPARGYVVSGQWRAVMELDAVADLEGVGPAVIGRLRHRRAEIADKVARGAGIVRVDPDQDAVIGGRRVDRGIGRLAVAVKARRSIGGGDIRHNTAPPGVFSCRRRRTNRCRL